MSRNSIGICRFWNEILEQINNGRRLLEINLNRENFLLKEKYPVLDCFRSNKYFVNEISRLQHGQKESETNRKLINGA